MHRRWLAGLSVRTRSALHRAGRLHRGRRGGDDRRDHLEAHIEAALPDWSLTPVVKALQALRGLALVAAATLVAELGDITRFANPRQFIAYMGLVPSEHYTGSTRRARGGITKAGNGAARRMLIEAAWSYRFPARIGRDLLLRQEKLSKPIRDIAWKAQERLCRRYRKLAHAGKLKTVITAAIARASFRASFGRSRNRRDPKLPRASKLKSRDCEEEAIDHNSSKRLGKAGEHGHGPGEPSFPPNSRILSDAGS